MGTWHSRAWGQGSFFISAGMDGGGDPDARRAVGQRPRLGICDPHALSIAGAVEERVVAAHEVRPDAGQQATANTGVISSVPDLCVKGAWGTQA